MVRRVKEGFRVGFAEMEKDLKSGQRNMLSAGEQLQVMED